MQQNFGKPVFAKPYLLRVLLVRPRLLISMALGLLCGFFFPDAYAHQPITKALIGWNLGTGLYLVLAAKMMFWSSHERMRTRALQHDEGRVLDLMLVVTATLMCVAAIVAKLAVVRDLKDDIRHAHIALAVLTIATCWAFTQVMFSLHYAHVYYSTEVHGTHGGLVLPGGQAPDYADFLYFACVIGTSGQNSDVSFTSRRLRRIGTLHCVLAYLFNTTLLALTVNIGSSLF